MRCPRLDHFVRFNPNGTVSRCGHMVNAPQFDTLDQMDSSKWLRTVRDQLNQNQWPTECGRCEQTENISGSSIRTNSIEFEKTQLLDDYLVVGGVLDNICNSACQFCNEDLSTKIGSLKSKTYPIVDNTNRFWELPVDRVTHLDLNGGEPAHSKNYKNILANLPNSVQSIRLNTNGSTVLTELEDLVARGIDVTVTVSFDGAGPVHDYVRWPIKWEKVIYNISVYRDMDVNLNLWTTVNALNVAQLPYLVQLADRYDIDHSWALLDSPDPLNIKYKNRFTLAAKESVEHLVDYIAVDRDNTAELDQFIQAQDQLRGISIQDYIQ